MTSTVQRREVRFYRYDGSYWPLQSGTWNRSKGMQLLRGATGLESPEMDYEWAQAPGIDGDVLINGRIGSRTVTLPIIVRAPDEAYFSWYMSRLTQFLATPMPGRLRVMSRNADRYLDVVYVDGVQGNEARGVHIPGRWWRAELTFRTVDPYWYDSTQESITFKESAKKLFFPIQLGSDGIRLNANATFGRHLFRYAGDAPTPMTIEVGGPCTGFSIYGLANQYSTLAGGNRFVVSSNIPAGVVTQWVLNKRKPNVYRWGPNAYTWSDYGAPWNAVVSGGAWPMIGDPYDPQIDDPMGSSTATMRDGSGAAETNTPLWWERTDSMYGRGQALIVEATGATADTYITIRWAARWNSWRTRWS